MIERKLSMKIKDHNFPDKNCVYYDSEVGVFLYHANCIDLMNMLVSNYPEGVFDMIFADPPYFLSDGGTTCYSGKRVPVDKGDWDKSLNIEQIHKFNLEWLSLCQQLLKPNGTIWVTGTHHVIYSVGFAMQQLGMKILNNITWEKPNPPPNLSCRYFTHSTESIIWSGKNEKTRHRFNYDEIKRINYGKQMKTVWTIPAPTNDEKEFGKHPTQKPVPLLDRIILSCTLEGDLIFDPFSGSSTTGISCIKLKRHFVGCEIEKEYIQLSLKRLDAFINYKKSNFELFEVLLNEKRR